MDVQRLESIFSRFECTPADLIQVLQDIQKEYNYLPHDELLLVSKRLGVPLTQVYSVATFYNIFSLVPKGKHMVKVCLGTACHLKGSPRLVEALERDLGIARGQTTDDMILTLETVMCLGACALAPLVMIDENYYAQSTQREISRAIKKLRKAEEEEELVGEEKPAEAAPKKEPVKLVRLNSVAEFAAFRDKVMKGYDPQKAVVRVCMGPGCLARGADKVSQAFKEVIKAKKLAAKVKPLLKETGCHGFCKEGPLVNIDPLDLFYVGVKPEDVEEILETTLIKGEAVGSLLYSENGTQFKSAAEVPFYRLQQKIATRNVGVIDPLGIEDIIRVGSYQAAIKALTQMTPEEVINAVEVSGLRGRGGGGFPTGRKWRTAARAGQKTPGPIYIICNGDEGDPGAFMDRAIMEGDPHAILEGMLIGGYAIGSHHGYIYVRTEYPIAVRHLGQAIEQARALGFLGKNILGTGFDFDIQIYRGAGAFVCGESTALFTSIEGKAGEPRLKYIRSVERGLWQRPTVLNNVESFANIPVIIDKGGEWYASIGTPKSTGTKVFSLVGKVTNVGLVEVPMGVSLRHIVEDIGGGLPDRQTFKAVQTGGPSGGVIPYEMKDLSVDFDTLTQVGSMMGSGGLIVMDSASCMVDVARYFISFCFEESCGKCTPCREGTRQIMHVLDEICAGRGEEWHLDMLDEVAASLQSASLCGLGQTAANPIISTMNYFRDEYEAHVRDKKCPALVCKALLKFSIDPETCTGCMLCARECPAGAITGKKKKPHVLDPELCIKCGVCSEVCKFGSVKVES